MLLTSTPNRKATIYNPIVFIPVQMLVVINNNNCYYNIIIILVINLKVGQLLTLKRITHFCRHHDRVQQLLPKKQQLDE